jgi:epoxyqueuosine reductase QueG
MSTTIELKSFCKSKGCDLTGVADLESFRGILPVIPADLLDEYSFAISIGVGLDREIIRGISDMPTPQYAQHCKDINAVLNNLTEQMAQWITERGFKARAIPASLKVDDEKLMGNMSHKAVARMAGLGWQGKSLLLITSEFGPRVRLATVLTDMQLEADAPLRNRCGKCSKCADSCPASAIRNVSTESNYSDRETAINLQKCHNKLLEFQSIPDIGYTFCGVCISACPFGKKRAVDHSH